MDRILIVEDELIVAHDIRKTLERNGYLVLEVARSAEKALALIEVEKPSFVLVDIFLKGNLTGIDLAAQLNAVNIPFIYVSANSNQPVLEAAKTTNPYGFIVKPFRERDLLVAIEIAKYRYEQNIQLQSIHANVPADFKPLYNISALPKSSMLGFENIIGQSKCMLQVFKLVEQVAPFDTSVLILGESGTGKEGLANCIVQKSKRSDKPYIKINCAALPGGLIESELFGHEKGAFTGATERKIGKFEQAAGGTILLDEIGEMPMDMQVKLLRVLQEKEIQRVGSSTTIKTDVRVIAATSRNLEKEVGEGRFRLDLYYRLNVFPITLPPLRERKEDIPLLANHFIQLYAQKANKQIKPLDAALMQTLVNYDWPGNIRELQFLIERTVLLTTGNIIYEIVLPQKYASTVTLNNQTRTSQTLEENERAYILSVLKQCDYKVRGETGAAAMLGMPPTTLHSKMKKLGIKKSHE